MRRILVTGSMLAALTMLVLPAYAQDTKSARGTVSAIAGDTVTVKAGTQELKLMLDAKTVVTTEGGGTATRAAVEKGAAGPKLTDLVKVGDNVEVNYREAGGMLHATSVRRVRSAGAGGGVSEAKPAAQSANGTVTAISGNSLTISGSSGSGATFTQSYTVDATTKVVAEGGSTASAKGKVTITDLVAKGNRVTVTYEPAGSNLHATEVRVHK